MNIWIVALLVFIINLPFGFWRANTKKFSTQWFLAVHIPVPLVVVLRIFSGIGYAFITFPVLITAFFLGQFLGGLLRKKFPGRKKQEV